MRLSLSLLFVLLSCSPPARSAERSVYPARMPVEAVTLLAELADTASATRVFLPAEVEKQAESIEVPDRSIGGMQSAVVAQVREAAIRGVVDTMGFAERRTLAILPGSDPYEASLLVRRAERARWRPARLASGQAVRQLFEWRFCRSGWADCTDKWWEQVPQERGLPHVSAK
jgi:hypothetical protein